MSKLGNALDMAKPGMSRLRGANASLKYSSVKTYEEQQRPSWVDSLGKMAQAGADAIGAYDQRQRDLADERSNEIIRKLTPEQRREALNNGTLLYQDDPYAMEQLRFKTGRNAAYQVDSEISEAIKNGEFRTREELEQRRHARLQEAAKMSAEEWGIKEGDADYQRGFNADITNRNVALFGAHDVFMSQQAQKGAILNSKVELKGVLGDPATLARPESGEFFSKYIDNGLVSGAIPNDAQASQIITGTLNDVVQRPGSAAFLMSLEDKKVTLNGSTTTYKELMGDEQWASLKVKAMSAQYENDAKITEKFDLGISSALNQADATTGWEMLQGIKADLDKRQPGEEMTPQRQQLINAQSQMMNRFNQESAKTAKAMDDSQKVVNKSKVIDEQFTKRLSGEYVSTDFKDMPTNENTGEFKHSDMVNYANGKLQQIEAMDIPEQQKDRLKLDYLRVDSENGPFRTAVGTLVTDAASEWQAAIINGEMPEQTPALDNLRRLRNSDPNLVAALYPDKADLFLTMDMMDRQGIKTQRLLDAANLTRTRSKEMQFEADDAYKNMKNSSLSPEIKYLPAQLDGMARKIYDAEIYVSGNPDRAAQQVDKFLKESTTTFTDTNADGDTVGVIPRNALQVTDDPKSWEQGRDMIDAARKQLVAENPWMVNKQVTVSLSGTTIRIMDTTGKGVTFTKERLRSEYQAMAQKQAEAAREKALKDAQKRAPISQVTKARKVARERVINNRRKVPKKIYGSDN